MNKNLEKYDSACGQLKKKKEEKRSGNVCINKRGKKDALIRQDFNGPAIKRIVYLSVYRMRNGKYSNCSGGIFWIAHVGQVQCVIGCGQ